MNRRVQPQRSVLLPAGGTRCVSGLMAADRSLSSLQTIHLLDSSLWLQTRPGYVAVDQHASKIGEG
ncbi:hypothetical protein [Synechococcus sp. MIT S9509]|uniref:hypothetical protein n=1 Tax=unclassified Synechococcus TaxID=2626047 RepID=UPI0039AFDE11